MQSGDCVRCFLQKYIQVDEIVLPPVFKEANACGNPPFMETHVSQHHQSGTTVMLHRPQDVARRLDVSTSTLAKWRLTGSGPGFIKIGASVRYPESELNAFIAALPIRRSTSEGVR